VAVASHNRAAISRLGNPEATQAATSRSRAVNASKRGESGSVFGQQLRHWRHRSGLSQLDLAVAAGTTPRHISFLETGRSRPGRDIILRFCGVLDLPVRERNALLISAGLPPAFHARDLADEAMRPVKFVLDQVLQRHEPYPASVVGRGMQFLASNRAAETLFPAMCSLEPEQIVDLWFGPGPFREIVENWVDVVWAGGAALRREASRFGDPRLEQLVRRAEAHARAMPAPEPDVLLDVPVICPRLRVDGRTVRTISTVMRFDTAVDVTASELRVELMFPADGDSDGFFKQLTNSSI
jgi:transcriptional regulator with XRE-family HTH domain